MLKYWQRLVTDNANSIAKKVYVELLQLHNAGWKNWVSNVHKILEDCCPKAWMEQKFEKISQIDIVHKYLCNIYQEDWKTNILKQPKMRTYALFKFNFELESYLVNIRDFKLRRVLTRFRLSNHDLEIEVGRHKGLPVEERYCRRCTEGAIESEIHFVCECPAYFDLRNDFLQIVDFVDVDFVYIMIHADFQLAKLLLKMFKRRGSITI